MKIKLSSRQLRGLVRDAMPMTFDKLDVEPFTESCHNDGCLHYYVDYDDNEDRCFSVRVPLREFLAARFDVPADCVVLRWSDSNWRYVAEVDGVSLTEAEKQNLEQYEE